MPDEKPSNEFERDRLARHEVDLDNVDPAVREKLTHRRERETGYPWQVSVSHKRLASPKREGETVVLPDEADLAPSKRSVGIGRYSHGGTVKAGSPKLSAPCRDSKTIKC